MRSQKCIFIHCLISKLIKFCYKCSSKDINLFWYPPYLNCKRVDIFREIVSFWYSFSIISFFIFKKCSIEKNSDLFKEIAIMIVVSWTLLRVVKSEKIKDSSNFFSIGIKIFLQRLLHLLNWSIGSNSFDNGVSGKTKGCWVFKISSNLLKIGSCRIK